MRFTSNRPAHHCEFEPIQARDLIQLPIDRWASLPIEQRAQAEIASLLAFVDAPLHVVADGCFHRLLNALVDIGCEERWLMNQSTRETALSNNSQNDRVFR
jgi:hypothetical protein